MSSGFPTRSDTNRSIQAQNMARGLKFQIKKERGLHYLCNEENGAFLLRGNSAADLCLCFTYAKSCFLMTWLI